MPQIRLVRDERGVLREVGVPDDETHAPRPRPVTPRAINAAEAQLEAERIAAVEAAREARGLLLEGQNSAISGAHSCADCTFVARTEMGLLAHRLARH